MFSQPPHLAMRRAPLSLPPPPLAGEGWEGGTLAYRRSTTALTVRAFGPWAQLQARLPGTRQDVRSGKLAPTGERRPRVLTRALPAPACPSPGNAPPGPVVVPVSARSCPKLPEAARSCPKLPPKLPEAARSCPKLPEAARCCPKLPGCGVYRSARGHRTRSTSRNTFATGVLGEREFVQIIYLK